MARRNLLGALFMSEGIKLRKDTNKNVKEKKRMEKQVMPMHLQFFADGEGEQPQKEPDAQPQQAIQIDYDKLAQIVSGKQTAVEDTVLKGYFKQQGLSQGEVEQAIQAFKEQKAASQPDVNALQSQVQETQAEARKAIIEKEAVLEAVQLGIDAKTIPYVLKMADLSGAMGQDGKVDNEALKNAINKVLEDVPQLKPSQEKQRGFRIGDEGQQAPGTDNDALKKAFGI